MALARRYMKHTLTFVEKTYIKCIYIILIIDYLITKLVIYWVCLSLKAN